VSTYRKHQEWRARFTEFCGYRWHNPPRSRKLPKKIVRSWSRGRVRRGLTEYFRVTMRQIELPA